MQNNEVDEAIALHVVWTMDRDEHYFNWVRTRRIAKTLTLTIVGVVFYVVVADLLGGSALPLAVKIVAGLGIAVSWTTTVAFALHRLNTTNINETWQLDGWVDPDKKPRNFKLFLKWARSHPDKTPAGLLLTGPGQVLLKDIPSLQVFVIKDLVRGGFSGSVTDVKTLALAATASSPVKDPA